MALTDLELGVITLVRSAITGKKHPLPEGFTLDNALPIIYAHGITALAYIGAKTCGLGKHQKLFESLCGSVINQEKQDSLLAELTNTFDEVGFDYITLKGARLRKLYPQPYMRKMGDIDILIRVGQYERIRKVMEKLGFTESDESDHELQWNKSGVLIELHKRLIPSFNHDFYAYFGDGWDMVHKDTNNHWQMTPEDEFVYVFTHFVKHYRDGGIGLTHLTDLWVLRDTYDETQVEIKLNQLHLVDFYHNIIKVLDACFDGGIYDEKTTFITERILSSGAYGTTEMNRKAQIVRKVHNNRSVLLTKIIEPIQYTFPPYRGMCQIYPILRKKAYLLPVMWFKRIVYKLCYRRERIKGAVNSIQKINHANVDEYQKELEYVGLDFWF